MATTCTICGRAIDAGEGGAPRCCCEPAYQSDLLELIELSQRRGLAEEAAIGLDAPPSVREAIRLADGPLPALPEPPQEDPGGGPEEPPPAARRRTPLVLVPVIAVAAACVLFGFARSGRSAARTPAAPPLPAIVQTLDRLEPAPSAQARPPSAPEHVAPVARPPSPAPPARPARPHPQLASAPHPPRAAPSAPPPASPPPAPEPPSLMQAITEAVRAPKSSPRATP